MVEDLYGALYMSVCKKKAKIAMDNKKKKKESEFPKKHNIFVNLKHQNQDEAGSGTVQKLGMMTGNSSMYQ